MGYVRRRITLYRFRGSQNTDIFWRFRSDLAHFGPSTPTRKPLPQHALTHLATKNVTRRPKMSRHYFRSNSPVARPTNSATSARSICTNNRSRHHSIRARPATLRAISRHCLPCRPCSLAQRLVCLFTLVAIARHNSSSQEASGMPPG